MPRIAGTIIPDEKKIKVALTYIYGIGFSRAEEILKATGVDPVKRAKEITEDEVSKIQELIQRKYKVEGALREEIRSNIKRLQNIRAYRGMRHHLRLPARGQQTRTNSRTVRGNTRRTVATAKRVVTGKV